MTFVVKFGVNIQNTREDINENVGCKLENVVTTPKKTINNISTTFLQDIALQLFIVEEMKLTSSTSFST